MKKKNTIPTCSEPTSAALSYHSIPTPSGPATDMPSPSAPSAAAPAVTVPASLDYAAALAVVGNVEALAIIRRNAVRGVSWANVRDVISAARFKVATTCDVCAAFGVATVIPAGHASVSQRGVAACETCVTSPLWPAVAQARPETVRDVLTAGGFIA